MPERRRGLDLGRRQVGELVQEPPGRAGGHLSQLQPLILAPSEEAPHLVRVGGSRGREPRPEELVRGEAVRLAGPREDRREGPLEVRFDQRIGLLRTSSKSALIVKYNILYLTL